MGVIGLIAHIMATLSHLCQGKQSSHTKAVTQTCWDLGAEERCLADFFFFFLLPPWILCCTRLDTSAADDEALGRAKAVAGTTLASGEAASLLPPPASTATLRASN